MSKICIEVYTSNTDWWNDSDSLSEWFTWNFSSRSYQWQKFRSQTWVRLSWAHIIELYSITNKILFCTSGVMWPLWMVQYHMSMPRFALNGWPTTLLTRRVFTMLPDPKFVSWMNMVSMHTVLLSIICCIFFCILYEKKLR